VHALRFPHECHFKIGHLSKNTPFALSESRGIPVGLETIFDLSEERDPFDFLRANGVRGRRVRRSVFFSRSCPFALSESRGIPVGLETIFDLSEERDPFDFLRANGVRGRRVRRSVFFSRSCPFALSESRGIPVGLETIFLFRIPHSTRTKKKGKPRLFGRLRFVGNLRCVRQFGEPGQDV